VEVELKRIVRTAVALSAAAMLAPLTPAHAQTPFACNGSPEIPESYVCIVGFQVGADPVVTPTTFTVPSQSVPIDPVVVNVPSEHVYAPSQPVHIPQVCAGPPGFCVGPLDASTPLVDEWTPGVTREVVPGRTETTPEIEQTVPLLGVAIPPGSVLVLWYEGTCYYVWPDGSGSQTPSTTPSGCP